MAPPDSLSEAGDAIARAEQSDSRQYAGGELDAAKTAADEQNMAEAERLAQEALIAAELASARTSAAKAEEVNREMGRGAEAPTDEIRRKEEQ